MVTRALPALARDPHALGAERSLLGGILLDPEQFVEAAAFVRSEDFSSRDHAALFEAISALYRAGELIECHTLRDLDVLDVDVPHVSRLSFYAERIADTARRRRVMEAARTIVQLGAVWHGTVDEFCAEAQKRIVAASRGQREAVTRAA